MNTKQITVNKLIDSKTKYDLKLTILDDILKLEPCSTRGTDYLSAFNLYPLSTLGLIFCKRLA